jgi:putative glutamine amidotransferase
MSRRPVIGVCAPLERARWSVWDMPAALVGSMYLEAVWRAGGAAVLLPPDPAWAADPDEALDLLDGLVLVGGADLAADLYGETPHPTAEPPQAVRDGVEVALARRAAERGIPILGICRGMQVLNVAHGGTLWQHLPETHGTEEHRRNLGTFDGNAHGVDLTPGTLARTVIGEDRHTVLSHHHQGIRDVGEGLVVSGYSDDGVPETLERDDPAKGFLLGVQWHPEADDGSPVIAGLVEAARATLAGSTPGRVRPA